MAAAPRYRRRVPLMALAMVALLAGIWGGLLRLGWTLPALQLDLSADHGPLMVSGFLGTLIGLERAVALARTWAYTGPLLTGLGGIALIAGAPYSIGAALMTAGSLGLVVVFAVFLRQQALLSTAVMEVGALTWLAGNAIWLAGWPLFHVVSWWLGFLVLTIAGERLQVSRVLRLPRGGELALMAIVGLLVAGLVCGGLATSIGGRVIGLALIALAVWLSRYDIVRRTARESGLLRFAAICLLSGYAWLGTCGGLALYFGAVVSGFAYDAVLHTAMLGFVFAMIFGHAPMIFPAVLGLPMVYRPIFYTHLAVLQLSLLLRVYGDLAESSSLRQWGGLFNAVAVGLFLINTIGSMLLEQRRRGARPASVPNG